MSDNEAREETPPEYQPEDIGEDWDIYLQLKGVLLEPNCNDDETYYNKQNFTKLLQLEKGLIRNAPVLRLVGDQSISTISYEEYRILNKNMKEAHPFPYVEGIMPSSLHGVDTKCNMMDSFEPILIITYYKPTIFK